MPGRCYVAVAAHRCSRSSALLTAAGVTPSSRASADMLG